MSDPVTAENLTDEQVLGALDPNGATMKLGEITGHLEGVTPGDGHPSLYRAVESALRRLRTMGTVELVKGRGAGYRLTTAAINARRGGGGR